MTRDELIETLAGIEHQRWTDWQKWVHAAGVRGHNDGDIPAGAILLPAERVEAWERQILMPYAQLSEPEKESDREQVMRYWPVVTNTFSEWLIENADKHTSSWTESFGEALARAFREEMQR